jgi:two-component system response regulator FlrC
VRELENVVQRAVVLCNGRTITPAQLMFDESSTPLGFETAQQELRAPMVVADEVPSSGMHSSSTGLPQVLSSSEAADSAINLQHAVKSSEHQIIMAALQTSESREAAAPKLGISPRTLRYKLAQLRERGIAMSCA